MDRTRTQTAEGGGHDLGIRAEWSAGPRTAAWDRLWRAILGGLNVRLLAEDIEQLGREDADG